MTMPAGQDEVVEVGPEQWRDQVAQTVADGFTWFDSLIAIDEILRPRGDEEQLRVVGRFVRLDDVSTRQLQVRVPRDLERARLDSISDLVPGAAWYQREIHDFYGITFTGGDDRPLLWHHEAVLARRPDAPAHPLRKDELLRERVETPWPGAKEPGEAGSPQDSRRRTLPPGVPDPDVLADPDLSPTDLVAALGGGRVRRRR